VLRLVRGIHDVGLHDFASREDDDPTGDCPGSRRLEIRVDVFESLAANKRDESMNNVRWD
jgi:hypothetical protein